MTAEAHVLWDRAVHSLHAAEILVDMEPDSAVSRAYYAAFYAASAVFALAGRSFKKHSAVEAAVHRDLVKAGCWEAALGKDYTFLAEMRNAGDYGGSRRVTVEEARESVARARRILAAVEKSNPALFPGNF